MVTTMDLLTDIQKDIIKGYHGEFAGTVADYPAKGKMPSLNTMKIMQTPRTSRVCRVCRGSKLVLGIFKGRELFQARGLEPVIRMKCTYCGGTGRVYG